MRPLFPIRLEIRYTFSTIFIHTSKLLYPFVQNNRQPLALSIIQLFSTLYEKSQSFFFLAMLTNFFEKRNYESEHYLLANNIYQSIRVFKKFGKTWEIPFVLKCPL